MSAFPECKEQAFNGGIKAIYFIKKSDLKLVDGSWQLKRKYGKFNRKITKWAK